MQCILAHEPADLCNADARQYIGSPLIMWTSPIQAIYQQSIADQATHHHHHLHCYFKEETSVATGLQKPKNFSSNKWKYFIFYAPLSTLPSPLSRSPFFFPFTPCFGGGHPHAPLLPPPLTVLNPYLSTKVQSGTNAATPSTIPSITRFATRSLTSNVHLTRRLTISPPMKLAKLPIPMDPCNSSSNFSQYFPIGFSQSHAKFQLDVSKIKVAFTML